VRVVQLSLTPQEAASLREVLADCLADLRMEIANTDAHDYRERLKGQEVFLKRMIGLLAADTPPA
jgi:hypothetical protein